MMIHPQFDPVLISIGPLAIRWYALSYIVGFILFTILGRRRIAQGNSVFTKETLDDFLTWGILGVILGGRIGYVLFYKFSDYLANPLDIFKVWEGGVVVAMWLFGRKHNISILKLMDTVAPLVPLGLASGRIGNFINGELWGRVTELNAFWAMGFPQARYEDAEAAAHNPLWAEWLQQYGMLPRHPSQLYQFALEGICLFVIVWIFSKKPRPAGQTAALFLGGYGLFRFIAEFARQPDDYLGLLTLGLSMGQWLSVPMIVLGVIGFVWFGRKNSVAKA